MVKKPQDVTEAEFQVLSHLWDHGPSTTRQVADRLYPHKKGAAPTVLKLLERLEAKQCVERDNSGPFLVFSALVARDDLIENRLRAVADELCDGSWTPLLMNLVDPNRLSPEEIQMLRRLIDDLDETEKRKKRK